MRVALFFLFLSFTFGSDVIDLGTIVREKTEQSFSISISSTSEKLKIWAEKALNLHGGIRITNKKTESLSLHLEQKTANSVEVTLFSASSNSSLLKKRISGHSLIHATMQALDLCIQELFNTEGFFSGKMAFVSKKSGTFSELYVSDLLFSKMRQLTHDSCDALFPRWFPDGKKILYTTYKSGVPDLYMINLSSKKRMPFAKYEGNNTGGAPSPNGQNIAMILSATGNTELFTKNIHSPKLLRLTKDKGVKASPTWSPDGTRIIFVSDVDGRPQIFETNALKGPAKRVSTNISRHCTEPQWNPKDPDRILFTAAVNKSFQLAEFNFKTQKSHFLTNLPKDCIEGCWLNDGRHIIFTQRSGNERQLCILDSKTKQIKPLSPLFLKDAAQAAFTYLN